MRGPAARRQVAAKLTFRRHGSRSFLAHQHTPHPFHLTRPFYLPGDPQGMATLYLQSSSGGLYGDDDLSLHIALEEGAGAHVTATFWRLSAKPPPPHPPTPEST